MLGLNVNGRNYELDVDPETPLLWVLRDTIGLNGTKYGCGIAQCGACTVHVDGVPARSCSVPVGSVGRRQITTIEGLSKNGALHKVQKAWIEHDVPQCGYCQSGMIMAVAALLKGSRAPAMPISTRASRISAVAAPISACAPRSTRPRAPDMNEHSL